MTYQQRRQSRAVNSAAYKLQGLKSLISGALETASGAARQTGGTETYAPDSGARLSADIAAAKTAAAETAAAEVAIRAAGETSALPESPEPLMSGAAAPSLPLPTESAAYGGDLLQKVSDALELELLRYDSFLNGTDD